MYIQLFLRLGHTAYFEAINPAESKVLSIIIYLSRLDMIHLHTIAAYCALHIAFGTPKSHVLQAAGGKYHQDIE